MLVAERARGRHGAQQGGEGFQAAQVVGGEEVVDVREGGGHAARERLVAGKPSSGLSQISRKAMRCKRAISAASRAGSPRSQPSLMMQTIAPWPSTRRAQVVLKVCSASPMRVPPDQSTTGRPTSASAWSTLRARNWRVMRVSRVPNTNTSTCAYLAPEGVQEMEQDAGVGGHRAADVAEQHQGPGLRRGPRRARM